MTIATKLALLANTKEQIRQALKLPTSMPFSEYYKYVQPAPNPVDLFSAGQQGAIYDPSDLTSLWQDAEGTVPVTKSGDPIARALDKSGNGNHATQTLSAARPTYSNTPSSIALDKVDDALIINVPTGGWIGTMVLASANGTASYGVNIPAGNYTLGGAYFPATNLVGAAFRHGAMTAEEKESVESYFETKGAVRSFASVTDFYKFWESKAEITTFPLIDTSNALNISRAWFSCSKLTTFPLIDTSKVTTVAIAWSRTNIVSFPALNFSSLLSANQAWLNCSSLVNFPANMFDNVKGGDFISAFTGTKLSQISIDGILVSLVTSGVATGTRVFNQSGGSAPSATGQAAIDTLRSRGWTVSVTGGY